MLVRVLVAVLGNRDLLVRVSFVATNHKPLGTRQHYEGKDGHQPEVPRVPWGLFPEGSESFWSP